MLTTILVLTAAALGALVAWWAPVNAGARRRGWVEEHPADVSAADVERLLLDHGLSRADVRLVSGQAMALGIPPVTMWLWIRARGPHELALAVAAETTHDDLMRHLARGSAPDYAELQVFAALNGLRAATGRPAPGPGALRPPPRPLQPGWDSFFDDGAA